MKCRKLCVLYCLALFLSVSASEVIPEPLPSLTIELTPTVPGASETFSMGISGTWPNACPPVAFDVSVDAGATMWIDLLLPSVFSGPQDCEPTSSAWNAVKESVGPFPVELYDVYIRAVSHDAAGQYERHPHRIQIGTVPDEPFPDLDFAPGQRVVLLEEAPSRGLRAGQAGTIVCCDTMDCARGLLVSWDLWTDGRDDTSLCATSSAEAFPPGSATWVNPDELKIGRPFDQCGTIRRGLEGCIYFEADDGRQYNLVSIGQLYLELDTPGGIASGQRLRLQGLLDPVSPGPDIVRICPFLNGDVYHPIVSACEVKAIGCCGGELFPGDRVTLRVNRPRRPDGTRAPGLFAGAVGTVICCGPYGRDWVFVSWDSWREGVNAEPSCNGNLVPYPKDSGWWVLCDRVALEDDLDGVDDEYIVRIGANALRLRPDPTAPLSQQTLSGCTTVTVQSNFRIRLNVEVTSTSAAGGVWTGVVTPEIVEAGTTVVEICVRAEDVDLTAVPPGRGQQLASVSVFGVPAP